MCYVLMFSTNADKSLIPSELDGVFFVADLPANERVNLRYENAYRVATIVPDNCSCGFRIFGEDLAQSVGFCPPQDWYGESENDEEIIDTKVFFEFIKLLVNQGFKADSYVCWNGEENSPAKYKIQVDLKKSLPKNLHFSQAIILIINE